MMAWAPMKITLDQAHSTYCLLAAIAALLTVLVILVVTGRLQAWLAFIARLLGVGIHGGFRLWERTLAWARWPAYLALVGVLLGLGIHGLGAGWEWASVLIALILLTAGASACTAFMFVSLERYDVSRGYKAVHNPAKGQELARHVTRYGDRLGPLMLVLSGAATIAGFALLNESLYCIFGQSWYTTRDPNAKPGYLDFIAFSLIHLLSIESLLDWFGSAQIVDLSFVRKGAWPVTMLLVGFRSFFTLVLIQQIIAAVREQRLLWEMTADFWSPHAPIHERARGALTQFGPFTVEPLMHSLGEAKALTREQRDELPMVLADLGPLAIPELLKYLGDERSELRSVAAVALGRLGATAALPHLTRLCHDLNEAVRACAVDAIGAIAEAHASSSNGTHAASSRGRQRRAILFLAVGGRACIAIAVICWRQCRKLIWKTSPSRRLTPGEPVAVCVHVLRAALADPAEGVRLPAMLGLGRLGPRAAEAADNLIAILESGSDQERVVAANSLGKLQANDASVLAALVAGVRSPVAPLRAAAATALGHYGLAAAAHVLDLVVLLDDPLDSVRDAATAAIQEIGVLDAEATQALEARLAHPDNIRRAQTAEALGEMGGAAQPAAPALVDSLTDDNDLVRGKAAEALGRIGEAAAGVAVCALAKSLEDEDNAVQARAAEALGQMGPQGHAAIPNLIKSLHRGNPEVRSLSADSLGQLGATPARRDLETACRDVSPPVRSQALRALGALGEITPSTLDVLLNGLSDPSPPVRAAAVEALAACQSDQEPVIAAVAALLRDGNDDVVAGVMYALPRFGPGALTYSFDSLCQRLSDEASADLPVVAAEALGLFGTAACAAGPRLAIAAQTGNAKVRQAALRALTRILSVEAASAFAAGLQDAELDVRRQASAGICRLASPPDELKMELLEALRDPDLRVRANAATGLARFESLPAEAEPRLVACSAVASPALRRPVAAALGRIDSAGSRAALQTLMQDANAKVRQTATEAMNRLEAGAIASVANDPAEAQPRPVVEHEAIKSIAPLLANA
jgi:HEAT repeat protein